MYNGITPLPVDVDINVFKGVLNNLHPGIVFTVEESTKVNINGQSLEYLNFLDISVNVHTSGQVQTDVYYKPTNNHDYLDFKSHHPSHTRYNIPYNLAKRIFCSDFKTEELHLSELKQWLLDCNYPSSIIKKGFKNAKLQRPAPGPSLKKTSLLFFTTYYSNFSSHNIAKKCDRLLSESNSDRINHVFGNQRTVLALKQLRNLLRHLTKLYWP